MRSLRRVQLPHYPPSLSPPCMKLVKLNIKVPQTVRGVSSGDRASRGYDLEKWQAAPFPAPRGPKSRASESITSKQKGKQPGKRRDAGNLSRLPDMPLDVMYDVSYRIVSIAGGPACDDPSNVCRYFLLSARWIYCEYRGPTGPFVKFLRTRLRGWFGSPLSTISLTLNGLLRVLMT